jgi:hypothetical protein
LRQQLEGGHARHLDVEEHGVNGVLCEELERNG